MRLGNGFSTNRITLFYRKEKMDQNEHGEDEALEESIIANICWKCGEAPCEWNQFSDEIEEQGVEYVRQADDNITNNKIRKCLYRHYTYLKYGHLGKGVRLSVSPCVLLEIRKLYPEDNVEAYMGYQSS